MSNDGYMTGSDAERRLTKATGCPRCGVPAGRWCRNLRRRIEPAPHPHLARARAVEELEVTIAPRGGTS